MREGTPANSRAVMNEWRYDESAVHVVTNDYNHVM